ncbi:DUF6703 family protein [Microlunatus speluncae]|uniref:DUF6703 family protein n=1 Tax=Microlunatus speluncae TaxID=2594267 RepID=UPI0012664543|nr:DUF6703 family protein [Microlunatus speluncae]
MPETSQPSLRQSMERISRPALVRLTALPRLVVPLVTLALVAVGAFAPLPIAIPAFVLVFLFIAWISYLSWPAVTTSGKIIRAIMLVLIIILTITRL